jgi:AraC family transcriptional regulator of adaptative response/methylated-DNA-[protein]-cysteine methyltransferase
VATTATGVAAVLLGDERRSLLAELRGIFPWADLTEGGERAETALAEVIRLIAHPGGEWTLPLDIRGSQFHQRVWRALREIPAGTTATYGKIAEKLGGGITAQDVGEGCAANVLGIVIPCHRVIRTDGSLAGYRWGVTRKQKLLAMERDAVHEEGMLFFGGLMVPTR